MGYSPQCRKETTERLHFHFRGRYAVPISLDVLEEPYWPLISCSPPLMWESS